MYVFQLGFTPCKAKQPLGKKLQEKEVEKERENLQVCINCGLKPLVKGKHSAGREFQDLVVLKKKLVTWTALRHLGMMATSCNLLLRLGTGTSLGEYRQK